MKWKDEVPKETGDFFYTGPTPDGTEVVAIVQIFDGPVGERAACLFTPFNWRGNGGAATLHCAPIDQWKGKWSGPEHGLCCVSLDTDGSYRRG